MRPRQVNQYKPPLVIGVHGIRTDAQWQRLLAENLGRHGIFCTSHNFGRYGLHRFLFERSNEAMIDEFYEFYSDAISKEPDIDLDTPSKRPSVIAHSFGTYIVGGAMLKYPDIKFDKVIFCGSILPRDFDLSSLLMRDQVGRLRNEYGSKDIWAGMVGRFIANSGDSGRYGFTFQSKLLDQERFSHYTHSDFFRGDHTERYWLPFLLRPPLTLTTVHGRTISDDEFQPILRRCLKIDQDRFRDVPHFEDVRIDSILAGRWADIEPDIYTFLLDRATRKAVGYINAMPVDDATLQRIKKDGINPNEIQPYYIQPFEVQPTCNIYLVSIATDKEVSKQLRGLTAEPFELLVNAFVDKLLYYAINKHVRVNEIVAAAWTGEGRRLCEMVSMKPISHDQFGYPIYQVNLRQPLAGTAARVVHGLKRLLEVYAEMEHEP